MKEQLLDIEAGLSIVAAKLQLGEVEEAKKLLDHERDRLLNLAESQEVAILN